MFIIILSFSSSFLVLSSSHFIISLSISSSLFCCSHCTLITFNHITCTLSSFDLWELSLFRWMFWSEGFIFLFCRPFIINILQANFMIVHFSSPSPSVDGRDTLSLDGPHEGVPLALFTTCCRLKQASLSSPHELHWNPQQLLHPAQHCFSLTDLQLSCISSSATWFCPGIVWKTTYTLRLSVAWLFFKTAPRVLLLHRVVLIWIHSSTPQATALPHFHSRFGPDPLPSQQINSCKIGAWVQSSST